MTTGSTVLDLPPAEAAARVTEWARVRGLPGYRAEQLIRRLWIKPVAAWENATELPAALRADVEAEFPLPRLVVASRELSTDGTKKFLWRLADGEAIESVLIPSGGRRTLCISSQAGCALGCGFCATGRMGFRRNLTAAEIALQVRELVLLDPTDKPSNVVFMGMGEPLLNWPAVDIALSTLNDPQGFGIGARHITVSTVGILPGMEALRSRPEQFRLAISLHSPDPASRLQLMPIEKKYPMEQVITEARRFGRRLTFEYVMIAGWNDRDEDADRLIQLGGPIGAHINLLPLHPGGAPGLTPTSGNRIRAFADRLGKAGLEVVVRRSRGLDINAACGQLFVEMERKGRPAPAATA